MHHSYLAHTPVHRVTATQTCRLRQADQQTDGQTDRRTKTHTPVHRVTATQTCRLSQADQQTDGQTDRRTKTHTPVHRVTATQTCRLSQADQQTDGQTDRRGRRTKTNNGNQTRRHITITAKPLDTFHISRCCYMQNTKACIAAGEYINK